MATHCVLRHKTTGYSNSKKFFWKSVKKKKHSLFKKIFISSPKYLLLLVR